MIRVKQPLDIFYPQHSQAFARPMGFHFQPSNNFLVRVHFLDQREGGTKEHGSLDGTGATKYFF